MQRDVFCVHKPGFLMLGHIYIYIYIYIYLYHGVWADQRLATVLQISCYLVYKWFVTQL